MNKTKYTRTEENTLKARAIDKLFNELIIGYELGEDKSDDEKKTLALCFIKAGLYAMYDILQEAELINSTEAYKVAEVIRQIKY